MKTYDLFVPFKTSRHDGFYNAERDHARQLFGYNVRLLQQTPYHYLILENVSKEHADDILTKLRQLMPWASLRLNFSMLIEPGEIQTAEGMMFNGHLPTLALSQSGARPIRIDGNRRTEEGDARLFSALAEAETLSGLTCATPDRITVLALELFSSVDFEATDNAQFLTLTSALELLSRPGDRPSLCIDLINKMIAELDSAKQTAQGDERQALNDMRSTATQFWIKQSFRSAIRAVAAATSKTIGDTTPDQVGRDAVTLYDKRSGLVHRGIPVTGGDVQKIRQLVREVIAVELNCHHHIRERWPTA